jgi:hypothetical protein
MKKKKQLYLPPLCSLVRISPHNFICVSVTPEPTTSEDEDWNPDDDRDGGSIWID